MNILFAEDQEPIRQRVKTFFEGDGHQVTAVENGQELLDRLCTSPHGSFDAVVTDNDMPKVTGMQVLRFLKTNEAYEAYKKLPVIVMTFSSDEAIIDAVKTLSGIHVGKTDINQLTMMVQRLAIECE